MLAEFNWLEATTSSPIFLFIVLCSILTIGIAAERKEPDRTIRSECEPALEMVEEGDLTFRQTMAVENDLGTADAAASLDLGEVERLTKHLIGGVQRNHTAPELALMKKVIDDHMAVIGANQFATRARRHDLDRTSTRCVDRLAGEA